MRSACLLLLGRGNCSHDNPRKRTQGQQRNGRYQNDQPRHARQASRHLFGMCARPIRDGIYRESQPDENKKHTNHEFECKTPPVAAQKNAREKRGVTTVSRELSA